MNPLFSKILLFGEYSVMIGSKALTLPYRRFWGVLKFPDQNSNTVYTEWSNNELMKFLEFIRFRVEPGVFYLDLERFQNDIRQGIYFESNIPQQYGLGSSGALVAAVFKRYGTDRLKLLDWISLRNILAASEGYFHGKSSGTDPLSIFIGDTVLYSQQNIISLKMSALMPMLENFYIYDTGVPSSTRELVAHFREKINSAAYRKKVEEYKFITNTAIDCLLDKAEEKLGLSIRQLSEFQLSEFRKMIPESVRHLWQQGLDSDAYYFKLCGSGGGGYMLTYMNCQDLPTDIPELKKFSKIVEYLYF